MAGHGAWRPSLNSGAKEKRRNWMRAGGLRVAHCNLRVLCVAPKVLWKDAKGNGSITPT
jgi:hypothetical protein